MAKQLSKANAKATKSTAKSTAQQLSRTQSKIDGKIQGVFTDDVRTKDKKKSDDQWKKDLKEAYNVEEKNQIKASDKAYDNAKVAADLQATSRGMGRSSYNNATLANLDNEKVNAQNTIRDNISAAYLQAVQQQQNVNDQLQLQKDQFQFQQDQAAQQQANWQAQFDAQQQQQAWQNEYQQDEFKYRYGLAGGGASSGGSSGGGGGSGGNGGNGGNNGNDNNGKPSIWSNFINSLNGGGNGNSTGNTGSGLGVNIWAGYPGLTSNNNNKPTTNAKSKINNFIK